MSSSTRSDGCAGEPGDGLRPPKRRPRPGSRAATACPPQCRHWTASSSTTRTRLAPAVAGNRLPCARIAGRRLAGRRQADHEPAAGRAGSQVDEPAVVLDRAPDHGQPEAGAASSHGFAGVKRLEDPLAVLFANSRTVVGHDQGRRIRRGRHPDGRPAQHRNSGSPWPGAPLRRPPMASMALVTRFMTSFSRCTSEPRRFNRSGSRFASSRTEGVTAPELLAGVAGQVSLHDGVEAVHLAHAGHPPGPRSEDRRRRPPPAARKTRWSPAVCASDCLRPGPSAATPDSWDSPDRMLFRS